MLAIVNNKNYNNHNNNAQGGEGTRNINNCYQDYATIVSIEGIITRKDDNDMDTTRKKNRKNKDRDNNDDDDDTFRELITSLSLSSSAYYCDRSKIRLVAIGRAKLSYFQTKYIASSSIAGSDGTVSTTTITRTEGQPHQFEEDAEDDTDATTANNNNKAAVQPPEPILVARMELLSDSNENTQTNTSPIHALNRIATLAQRIQGVHHDRQKIVSGLQIAQTQLELAMETTWYDDADNIGASMATTTTTTKTKTKDSKAIINEPEDITMNTTTILASPLVVPSTSSHNKMLDEFLQEYYDQSNNNNNININTEDGTAPVHSVPLSSGAARCIGLENYGLGNAIFLFSSSYNNAARGSTLVTLTKQLAETVTKYYSPAKAQSEEFYYELFSWCAVRSIQQYISAQTLYTILYECTNTDTRLQIVYDTMLQHKLVLQELAKSKTIELQNCGEECDIL